MTHKVKPYGQAAAVRDGIVTFQDERGLVAANASLLARLLQLEGAELTVQLTSALLAVEGVGCLFRDQMLCISKHQKSGLLAHALWHLWTLVPSNSVWQLLATRQLLQLALHTSPAICWPLPTDHRCSPC